MPALLILEPMPEDLSPEAKAKRQQNYNKIERQLDMMKCGENNSFEEYLNHENCHRLNIFGHYVLH